MKKRVGGGVGDSEHILLHTRFSNFATVLEAEVSRVGVGFKKQCSFFFSYVCKQCTVIGITMEIQTEGNLIGERRCPRKAGKLHRGKIRLALKHENKFTSHKTGGKDQIVIYSRLI